MSVLGINQAACNPNSTLTAGLTGEAVLVDSAAHA